MQISSMNTDKIKNWLSNIRFWIILFFIVRLFGVTNPPLEVAHNWRQTTVTMVARNFLEVDNSILYPRIDIAGEKPGITGMEFPVLNYLIYLMSLVFGYAHWYGRLINLIVSSIGIFYFYKIIRKYFTSKIAFYSAFLLLLSVWYTYSRKIMPDTFSMSLLIIGYYHGTNYLDKEGRFRQLFYFFVFTLLGILAKLPSIYILSTLVMFIFNKQILFQRKIVLVGITGLLSIIVAIYYFYWAVHLTNQYEFSHFFLGKSFSEGIVEIFSNLNQVFDKFYEEALGYTGFVLFLFALLNCFIKKNKLLTQIFTISFLSFLLIIFKSGFAFYEHSYYIIPFAPIMALIVANFLESLKIKHVLIFLTLFTTEAIISKNHDFYIKEQNSQLLYLEPLLDSLEISRSDLILINSGNVPTPMYFAHRKGWVTWNNEIENQNYINDLKAKGLRYIIILKRTFGSETTLNYSKIFDNQDFAVYSLE